MSVFLGAKEWFTHFSEGSVQMPMHYFGMIHGRCNDDWVRRFGYDKMYAHGHIWYTADLDQILVSKNQHDINHIERSLLLRSLEQPAASLAFVLKMIKEEDDDIRKLIKETAFGVVPASSINAGVQPSPTGGNVVAIQDGIFMSVWCYENGDAACSVVDKKLKKQVIDLKDMKVCHEMVISSLNVVGFLPAAEMEQAASNDSTRKSSGRLIDMGYGGGWPVSRVYGDGKSMASHFCGFLSYFVTLHEIGHIACGHTEELKKILERPDPREFIEESELSQREFDADAFAMDHIMKHDHVKQQELGSTIFVMLLPFCIAELALERYPDFFEQEGQNLKDENQFCMNGFKHPSWIERAEKMIQRAAGKDDPELAGNIKHNLKAYALHILNLYEDYIIETKK